MLQHGAAPNLDVPAEDIDPGWALVVAPAREQRVLLSHLLRQHRFEVAAVRDESEALDRMGDFLLGARPRRFKLIVVDMRARQRRGPSLFLGLRQSQWRPPVLLVVASGDHALRTDSANHGATAVLEWPFASEAFERAVLSIRQQQPLRTR